MIILNISPTVKHCAEQVEKLCGFGHKNNSAVRLSRVSERREHSVLARNIQSRYCRWMIIVFELVYAD
jgi:hypothetical protein